MWKVLLLGEDLLTAARSIGADTEEEAFETVNAEMLLNTVLKLPIEFREVLMLAYYEGMDLREVADALNIPPGTVRSRLFRARQRLKQLLEEEGWER
jgi:RNA polymerase sigma factor (sigma-70 family)